jgi:hypothetical protein
MKTFFVSVTFLICSLMTNDAFTADYEVTRNDDGPFSLSISGIAVNEGSTLQRESILFNANKSPAKLTSHKMEITYKDRGFRFTAATNMTLTKKVQAIQVRTILYDVFGQHMKNLANTEVKDFEAAEASIQGEWRAYESEVTEFLTAVTYVARIRFDDGTQWVFNQDDLHLALLALKLEKKIGDDSEKDQ